MLNRVSLRPQGQQNPSLGDISLPSTQAITWVFTGDVAMSLIGLLYPVALGGQSQSGARKWSLDYQVFGFSPAGISTYFADCLF